jgi:hypothetical protein
VIITKDSHADHLPEEMLDAILKQYGDKNEFFIDSFELPEGVEVECGLYGPTCGDPPVPETEVFYARRQGREGDSRLVNRPTRMTRTVTVIGGPHEGECILYTAFGGPLAEREPWDPSLDDAARERAKAFWAEHALAAQLE